MSGMSVCACGGHSNDNAPAARVHTLILANFLEPSAIHVLKIDKIASSLVAAAIKYYSIFKSLYKGELLILIPELN